MDFDYERDDKKIQVSQNVSINSQTLTSNQIQAQIDYQLASSSSDSNSKMTGIDQNFYAAKSSAIASS